MFVLIGLAVWLLALTIAITVHESAHAYMADKLGDPTPRLHGRLSLNPLNHYDRVGTTVLLVTVVMRALGAPVIPIGWAKPVQFDPYNLDNPRRDAALISLAGPASNILTAIIISLLIHLPGFVYTGASTPWLLTLIAEPIITINIILALFNLIPVHPLDGGKILVGLLPKELAYETETFLSQYGMIILLLLIFPFRGVSPIFALLSPALNFLLPILLP